MPLSFEIFPYKVFRIIKIIVSFYFKKKLRLMDVFQKKIINEIE